MSEPTDLELAIEAGRRELAALRALRERARQHRLEDGDWAVIRALITATIEEAEPGQEWVTIGPADGACGVEDEDSTPERRRR
jgi:hypothetical protein